MEQVGVSMFAIFEHVGSSMRVRSIALDIP